MDEDAEIVDFAKSPTTGCAVTNAAAVIAADKQSSSPESKEMIVVDAGYCAINHLVAWWSEVNNGLSCNFILSCMFLPMFACPGKWI